MNAASELSTLRDMERTQIHPVILNGASGARCAPTLPVSKLAEFASPIIVVNEASQLGSIGQPAEASPNPHRVILVPPSCGTGPVIGVAALWLESQDPGALMLVQPPEPALLGSTALSAAVRSGRQGALAGRFIAFGVTPTGPSCEHAYLRAGTAIDGMGDIRSISEFIEKPDKDAAARLWQEGNALWNSGVYLILAKAFLDGLRRHNSATLMACERAFRAAAPQHDWISLREMDFDGAPAFSLDCAMLRHIDHAAVVPVRSATGGDIVERLAQVHRPWGSFQTLDAGVRFQVKRIVVNPGASLSLQKHHHRAEHWVLVRGSAVVQVGDVRRLLTENESVYIPVGVEHRLQNPGKLHAEIIEVQSGAYLGEDDIVRISDVYGRCESSPSPVPSA